jgi:hypothetical protein
MKKQSFHDSITKLLLERLSKRKNQNLNRATCIEIYNDIFFTLSEVIKTASTPLSNESVNFLAQMYYDSISINENQELDPNIFTQRAKLGNIETKEIALLAVMLSGTEFASPFIAEVKLRS